jgi:thiol-disulfide isomerase/thioredoxin
MRTHVKFLISTLVYFIFIIGICAQDFKHQQVGLWNKIKAIKLNSITSSRPISLDKNTVFIFLSPECPLSRNYIPELKRIQANYKNFEIIGVFPGKSYTAQEIKNFLNDYKITFSAVQDGEKKLTKLLNATVTPEVVLLNKIGKRVYSGLIDDKIIELGQQKQVASKHFLTDAIESIETDKKVLVSFTKPIGCYINDL